MVGGWITVTVLVLVLGATLELDVGGADVVVSVAVAGGTVVAAVVVTVDVAFDVETDVLVALAGLSTPHAMALVGGGTLGTHAGALVEQDCRALRALELILGEAVAGGDEFAGTVGAHQQRRKIPARGLSGMTRRLEVVARGSEITFTLADRMDVQTVQAGREDSGPDSLDGHRGVPAGEVDGRIGDIFAVGRFQLGRQRLSAGRRPRCGRLRQSSAGWFAQPLNAVTGAAIKAMAAVTCLIMSADVPLGTIATNAELRLLFLSQRSCYTGTATRAR